MRELNEEKARDGVIGPAEDGPEASPAAAESTPGGTPATHSEAPNKNGAEGRSEVNTRPAATQDVAGTAAVGKEAPAPRMYEETFAPLEPGQIVQGRVVQVNQDEVMIDVGYKSEGRIPLAELGMKAGQKPEDVVQPGDVIDVFILKVEDSEGNVLLSKRRAEHRVVWERLEKLKESGEPFEAKVTERVKGGLLVDVGVRGFVPASHIARNYVENLDKFIGETLRLKVIEIDRRRNNVVLSRKDVLEQEYEEAKADTFASLQEGATVEGLVRRLTDFGAFVDIGRGVEGLLHVSEMAWSRVRHPSDVLSEGQSIQVRVLHVDREKERISLSLKETLPDPWENIGRRYHVGDLVNGEVTRVVDFGAFVKLEDGVEGLIHVSQLADRHVANPAEVVSPGEEVTARIVNLDEQARRIGLSLREAAPRAEGGRERQRGSESYTDPSQESVKLGDVFGNLGDFFGTEAEADDRPRSGKRRR